MQELESKDFIEKLARMDSDAWRAFCRGHAPLLLRYARLRFGCDRDQAEEIVQRAFVRSVRSIRQYDPTRGTLADWLKGICRREGSTVFGARRREIPVSQIESQDLAALERIDEAPLPDEVTAKREVQGLVNETIGGLYGRYRDVLILKYLKGKRVAVIASELGESEKAVESLLSRSRQAFRTAFLGKIRSLRNGGTSEL
jgi:RNA polymerase sigma-70 factor (ECF subfamily)